MGWPRRVGIAFVLGLGWLCCVGCDRHAQDPVDAETATRYGDLPGMRSTHHAGLRAELARLIHEKATPAALAGLHVPARGGAAAGLNLPGGGFLADQDNVAAALATVFEPQMLSSRLRQVERVYPAETFQFDAVQLQAAISLRTRYETQRRRFRQALAREGCDFNLQHKAGLLADMSFVDAVRLGSRLEGLLAAEYLAHDEPERAIEPLQSMLRAATCLSREANLVPRLAAVHVRAEALLVLEAIAQHPLATFGTHNRLYALLQQQLLRWAPDRRAWFGERAQGLHTYELIRDGYLLSILSPEETQALAGPGGLPAFLRAVSVSLDEDEWFYLRAMRRIIDSCDQPYYQRRRVLEGIEDELEELRNTPRFPIIAARVLLHDVRRGHQLQAADRAGCEAWTLALAAATERELPDLVIHPLTGQRYQLQRQPARIIVWGAGGEALVVLPLRAPNRFPPSPSESEGQD